MTETAERILAEFELLSEQERHDLLVALLRQTGQLFGDTISDELLVSLGHDKPLRERGVVVVPHKRRTLFKACWLLENKPRKRWRPFFSDHRPGAACGL